MDNSLHWIASALILSAIVTSLILVSKKAPEVTALTALTAKKTRPERRREHRAQWPKHHRHEKAGDRRLRRWRWRESWGLRPEFRQNDS